MLLWHDRFIAEHKLTQVMCSTEFIWYNFLLLLQPFKEYKHAAYEWKNTNNFPIITNEHARGKHHMCLPLQMFVEMQFSAAAFNGFHSSSMVNCFVKSFVKVSILLR